MGVLADRYDAGVADDVAYRLQIVERRLGGEVGEWDGVAAKPAGERVGVG
ncbi:hypothetical protein ABZ912_23425 [Nonomuraea angiospora]